MEYVEDMTWREFQLRKLGYSREDKTRWLHTREVTYHVLVATGAIDTRKMSKEKFMPLENGSNKTVVITSRAKEIFMKAVNDVVNESGSRNRS
ncbi:hypothetical protein [uncultured Chryseobacterium sp.]|uniref:hypothetical protein n=1 Tax=uncultured Chryseobacterium sp. TaxID=259322 RepID=UPI00258D3455|nr:hypothetical protein [uncultured Chryseobacterium sp.]